MNWNKMNNNVSWKKINFNVLSKEKKDKSNLYIGHLNIELIIFMWTYLFCFKYPIENPLNES